MRREHGIAVPVVLMVMVIVLLLGGAAVLAAIRVDDHTRRDTFTKSALEAADAGLRTATYRLNMLGTSEANCPTTPTATAWNASTRLCQRDGPSADDARWGDSAPDDPASHLGNGGTFSYWVSAPLRVGDSCAGSRVLNSQYPISQRCVTSVGTVNGASARTQARVASFAAQPLFPGAGLIGVHSITIKPGNGNGASIQGTIGSNGAITLGNNVTIDGTIESGVAAETGPSGSLTLGNNGDVLLPSATPVQVDASQLNIAPVSPGCSSSGVGTSPAGGGCWNSDDRIAGCTTAGSATVDACNKLTWTAGSRSVSIGNNGSVTLHGGPLPYNFCNFTTGNGASINIPIGAHVVIFIDSSSANGGDPNGNCPAGSGNLTLSNKTAINNLNADPLSLQIYVYGTSPQGSNVVTWNNNAVSTYATLYAPNSTVNLQNNGTFWGAIGAYNLGITNNFTFKWIGTESTLTARPQGLYYRTAWTQCPVEGC